MTSVRPHGLHGAHGGQGLHGTHGGQGTQGAHGLQGAHGAHGAQGTHGAHGTHGGHGLHGVHVVFFSDSSSLESLFSTSFDLDLQQCWLRIKDSTDRLYVRITKKIIIDILVTHLMLPSEMQAAVSHRQKVQLPCPDFR